MGTNPLSRAQHAARVGFGARAENRVKWSHRQNANKTTKSPYAVAGFAEEHLFLLVGRLADRAGLALDAGPGRVALDVGPQPVVELEAVLVPAVAALDARHEVPRQLDAAAKPAVVPGT